MLEMGIIKVEINLPELKSAIEGFRKNRMKALESVTHEIRESVSRFFNQLLNMEMTFFLGRSDQESNKRNGYYERQYALKGIGALRLRMPVDRKREFKSEIIPAHERLDPRLKEDLALLHLAGISTRMIGMISRRLLGIEVSSNLVSSSLGLIEENALSWLNRPIVSEYWGLFVDGTNFRIQRKGSTQKEPTLVAIGLDAKNRMSILAMEPGQKDSADCWRSLFQELKNRGLNFDKVRLGIMDGLPGLEKVFQEEFPRSQTARCWVHALRNAMNKVPNRFSEAFKKMADAVMYAENENAARVSFLQLKKMFGKDAERAVSCLEKDLESLLVHYRFDPKLWRSLRTTNPIERVNKELKRRTKTMETLGERTLRIVTAFVALRLEYYWNINPLDMDRIKYLKPFQEKQIQNQIESTLLKMIQ
jgi:putative transposase